SVLLCISYRSCLLPPFYGPILPQILTLKMDQVKGGRSLYGRITGLRTMKGEDINYQHWDEDEYKINSVSADKIN
ncbi:MAG: hypothetical protein ACYSRP_05260, partial [Planctomycetota bacterium]